MIPVSSVQFGPDVEESVLEVLRSGHVAQGPMVERLEQGFVDLVGARNAVAVNNGTTALVASIEALGLRPGDEVITSPFTFVATLNAILESGATARFADIREEDFCIDPAVAESRITDRTRVIMPVHLYGQSADMDPIMSLAVDHDLDVVEDAAQAHGARYHGRGVGTFGVGTFSLYGTKNLTSGEGGVITTDDDELAARLRILRNQGMRQRYEYVMAGHNYRLTDLQAAVALPQLADYDAQLAARRRNAAHLTEGIGEVRGLVLPRELEGREHVWHQYTVLLPETVDRDAVVARLSELGVGSGVYYPRPVYDYDVYRASDRVVIEPAPVAESVARRCLSLPVHQHLSDDDVDRVAAALRQVLGA